MNDPRRRRKRVAAERAACEIGEVVDISGDGMRVVCGFRSPVQPGQVIQMDLKIANKKLKVAAQAVWKKRMGVTRQQFGFRFVGVKPEVAEAIQQLAELGFIPPKQEGSTSSRPAIKASVKLQPYFEALGLKTGDNWETVRRTYRVLAKTHHPDISTLDNAEEKFQEIHQAYAYLKSHFEQINREKAA